MSEATYDRPYRQTTKVGIAYAPTLGKFRGRVIGTVHAVCRHEHSTENAAITCARKLARAAVGYRP